MKREWWGGGRCTDVFLLSVIVHIRPGMFM